MYIRTSNLAFHPYPMKRRRYANPSTEEILRPWYLITRLTTAHDARLWVVYTASQRGFGVNVTLTLFALFFLVFLL